jgi:predicted nuclease with TOPRIM domain
MMMQQPQQQMMMQQQPQMNLYKDVESEKTKILKELDMIDSEKSDIKNNNLELTEKELFETKSFTSHIKETFLVILLYIIIGNDYINEYITKYIPYLSETPSILLAIKVILMGLLFHTIRYFMNR